MVTMSVPNPNLTFGPENGTSEAANHGHTHLSCGKNVVSRDMTQTPHFFEKFSKISKKMKFFNFCKIEQNIIFVSKLG